MWVRKTESEKKTENSITRRFSSWLGRVLGFTAISLITLTVVERFGLPSWFNITRMPKKWSEVFAEFPRLLDVSILAGLIVGTGWPLCYQKTMLCSKCEKTKNNDGNYNCSCGGNFEDIADFKWVESDKEQA